LKKRILIIEDDSSIREIISWLLEEEGYKVTSWVTLGAAGSFAGYNADLIFLDEWINKNEGYRLCEEIKLIRELQHIPVIILSTSPFIEKIAANCKADGFIRMPFGLAEVISEVEKCFSADEVTG
jgi:two-component system OmpR family response regulator